MSGKMYRIIFTGVFLSRKPVVPNKFWSRRVDGRESRILVLLRLTRFGLFNTAWSCFCLDLGCCFLLYLVLVNDGLVFLCLVEVVDDVGWVVVDLLVRIGYIGLW